MKEASWKKAFPDIYHEIRSRYPQSDVSEASLIYLACKENLIDSQTYLNWAHRYYAIAILEDRFFDERFDRATYEKLSGVAPWSEEFFPVFEWDGVIFVACLDPYVLRTLNLEFMIRPLLTSFENLFKGWLMLTGQPQSGYTDNPEFDKTIPSIAIDSQIADSSQNHTPNTHPHEDFISLEDPIVFSDEESPEDPDKLDLLEDNEAPQLTGIEDQESLVTALKSSSDIPDGLLLAEDNPPIPKPISSNLIPPEDLFLMPQTGPTPARPPENKVPVVSEIQDISQFKVPPRPIVTPPKATSTLSHDVNRQNQVQKSAPPKPPFAKTPIEAPPIPPPFEPPPIDAANNFEGSHLINTSMTSLTSATQVADFSDVLMNAIKDKMGLAYNFYNKIMLLIVNSNETATPVHWDQHFKPKGVAAPIPLFQPSPFRIAYRTNKPFHGKTHTNPILQKFSADWLNGESIYFLTITPLLAEGTTFALLLGIADNDIDQRDSLNNFIGVTEEITKQITQSVKAKTA